VKSTSDNRSAVAKKKSVDFAFTGAALGGDDCRSYNHSNKDEGDQDVMHWVILLLRGSSEPFNTLIIGGIGFFLNSTKLV
jgi:hypothetical protein